MAGAFSVERSFFSFLLELCDFYKQLVEIFHAELLYDMVTLREIIAADKFPAGFVIVNAGE